jgi:hypothetical protein
LDRPAAISRSTSRGSDGLEAVGTEVFDPSRIGVVGYLLLRHDQLAAAADQVGNGKQSVTIHRVRFMRFLLKVVGDSRLEASDATGWRHHPKVPI